MEQHTEIEYVWYDYWCLPQTVPHPSQIGVHEAKQNQSLPNQRTKTEAEKKAFNYMLRNIHNVYLGCSVLILLDDSYFGRFWTQFEAWMSMRTSKSEFSLAWSDEVEGDAAAAAADADTVSAVPSADASADAESRWTAAVLYGKTALEIETMTQHLISKWQYVHSKEAHDKLNKPDCLVTNDHDKHVMLMQLLDIEKEVKRVVLHAKTHHEESSTQNPRRASVGGWHWGLPGHTAAVAADHGHGAQKTTTDDLSEDSNRSFSRKGGSGRGGIMSMMCGGSSRASIKGASSASASEEGLAVVDVTDDPFEPEAKARRASILRRSLPS